MGCFCPFYFYFRGQLSAFLSLFPEGPALQLSVHLTSRFSASEDGRAPEPQLRGHQTPRAVPAARTLPCTPLGEVWNQDKATPAPLPCSISPATEPALPPDRSAEPAKAEGRHAGLREVSPTRQAPPIPEDARGTPPDSGRPRTAGRAAPPTRSGPEHRAAAWRGGAGAANGLRLGKVTARGRAPIGCAA